MLCIGVFSTARSRHFNLHPSHLPCRSLCFHPQTLSRASLPRARCLNFWPRDPVRTSPTCPPALRNRLSEENAHDVAHRRRARAPPHVCVAAYLRRCRCSAESQSAPSRANAFRSLSGSPDRAAPRKLHPATQTSHRPQQRSGGDR